MWYYYMCPMAWTVYGLIVSQFGDVTETVQTITIPHPTVRAYMEEHYGYNPDFMGQVAIILVGFPVFFAIMYAFCIKTLNFQTR